MELKSVLRFAGLVLSPACACLIISAGCETKSELPLPPGAYDPPPARMVPPENSAQSTDPKATFPTDTEEQSFTLELLPVEETPTPSEPQKAEPAKTKSAEIGGDDILYTIRKNDTLSGIARRHGMSAATLADYNGISLKSKIYAGKTLRIPAQITTTSTVKKEDSVPAGTSIYVVKSGDTLGGIAKKHSIRTADLAAANHLDVRKPIFVGQKLVLPDSTVSTKKTAVSSSSTVPAPAKSDDKAAAPKQSPAPKTATAKKAAPARKADPAPDAGQSTADDLLKNIGSEPETSQPASGTGSIAVASPEKEDVYDADHTFEINLEREMTLEEAAKAFDRSYSTLKKLNPTLSPDARLKAGTPVRIPIF